MPMIEGTDGFSAAREKFLVIGILGQTYSGQSTFFNSVLSSQHFGVMDHRGVFEDIVLSYLEGDPNCVEWYNEVHQNGAELPRQEGDEIIYDEPGTTDYIYSEEYLTDNEKMQFIRQHSFNKKMPRISDALKEIVENNPNITEDMQVPLFVDLPMCEGVDYYEYVDQLIVIKRPTNPDANSWYIKYMCASHDENTGNFIDLCVPTNKDTLLLATLISASDDEAFSEIVIDESKTTIIENFGTIDEYLEKIDEILYEYRNRSQDALAQQINQISQEVT